MDGVSVAKIAKKMELKNFTEEIELKEKHILLSDVNRPALQLSGYFEYFDPSRVEIIGMVEYAYLQKKTEEERKKIYDEFLAYDIPCVIFCREFEPDAPNYTPRISGIMHIENGTYNYAMSILKSSDGNPGSCSRYTFAYEHPADGEGRFIHTYMGDGNPLPSFEGEPKRVKIEGSIDGFTSRVWGSLNEENKVSLFVRFIRLSDGSYETRIINKNQ